VFGSFGRSKMIDARREPQSGHFRRFSRLVIGKDAAISAAEKVSFR
jgi:hypothetical protein